MNVQTFVPGNISCVFAIHNDPDPQQMGSLGLGFTINQGVTANVSHSDKTEILWNNQSIILPTVHTLISQLITHNPQPLHVALSSRLPLGSGFGLSGASALATAYAVNQLLNLNLSRLKLAQIAHRAEVMNKTGLGDIVNQWHGGVCLKLVPSSRFEVIPVPVSSRTIYCHSFGKRETPSVLNNADGQKRINVAAIPILHEVEQVLRSKKTIALAEMLTASKRFAVESGLLHDQTLEAVIAEIESRGGHASMIMLGNAVMSDIPFPGAIELEIATSV